MYEMKESGIEWIGQIPKHWEVRKVKYIFTIGRGRVIGTELLADTGYPVYSSQTLHEGLLGFISSYDYDYEQLTWTTDGANAGTVFLRNGKYNCTNVCGTLCPKITNISMLYLKFILEYTAVFYKRADTNGYKIMNNEMANILLLFPPLDEQKKIADFLDKKVSEIENLIDDTKKLIEKYREYKQSIITETVTKGLNSNVEMKESGIEWIGQIPKHWGISRLKYLFSFEKGLSITKEDLKENGISVISYGQLHSKSNKGIVSDELIRYVDETYLTISPKSLVNCGDFIFADTSEDYMGCGNNVYVDKDIVLFAGYHTIILKATKYRNNKYLSYLFYTDYWRHQIRSKVFGIKLFSITQKILKETFVILPPLTEQEEIVKYLDDKCSQIDNIIEEKQLLLEKLEEYKKSLIYEYVTGKKQVENE